MRRNSGFNFLTSGAEKKWNYTFSKATLMSVCSLPTHPSQTPIKLCSRPDEEITQKQTHSHNHLSANNSNNNGKMGLALIQDCKWPAITVLFPSSTRSVSLDKEESNTFPSISLPCKQSGCQRKTMANITFTAGAWFSVILGCLGPANVLPFDADQFGGWLAELGCCPTVGSGDCWRVAPPRRLRRSAQTWEYKKKPW